MKYLTIRSKPKFSFSFRQKKEEGATKLTALDKAILKACDGYPYDRLEILNRVRPYVTESGQSVIANRQLTYNTIAKLVKAGKLKEV
jgi:hypothetical protein